MAQAETATRVEIGTLIADTYEIKRLLGRGGMGTVWEATHARLPGKRVAIKVLHPEVAKDQESLARFRREAEIASRIGHPNIVDVHDFNELTDGTPYLILEYLEGISLEDRIEQGAMPLDEVISLTRQIGSALRAAHAEGVIHRDLKPQNIFLARTTDAAGNEASKARVLDFGISKIRGSSTVQTQDSTILGTPQYMAPEQATGNHSSVDQRTDVFAFGAIVYEMLSGRPAFDGQTIPEVVFKVVYEQPIPLEQLCNVPPAIARAVHQALEKGQDDRFQTVEAFIEALSGTALSVRGAPVPTGIHAQQGKDVALANTVASGNFPPVPGVSGPAIGTAATVDSGRMDSDSLGLGRAPVAQSSVVHGHQTEPTGAGGKTVAIALAAVLLVVGGGLGFWALTRDSGGKAAVADADAGMEVIAKAPALDAGTKAPVAVDAAVEVKDPAKKDPAKNDPAKKDPPKKDPPKKDPPKKDPPKKDGDDPTVTTAKNGGDSDNAGPDDPNKDYAKAQSLLHSNPKQTVRLMQRAIGNGQRSARFYVLKAKAHCKLKDLTRLNATLAKVPKRRRASVERFCDRVWPGR